MSDEPRIEDATQDDLTLAIQAIGQKAMYGGLLSCALAGIYAERARAESQADEVDPRVEEAGSEGPMKGPEDDVEPRTDPDGHTEVGEE